MGSRVVGVGSRVVGVVGVVGVAGEGSRVAGVGEGSMAAGAAECRSRQVSAWVGSSACSSRPPLSLLLP